jgi:glycine/D-amino acid oxidase-like deaminating enzyme/nitrite reductase/ring-hydroxylating ferredoxin subunit
LSLGYAPEMESYWMASSPPTDYPHLDGDANADVAVIGAGMVGLCVAWQLARAGRSVIVVEADRIVAATTGNTTGKLTAQHTLIYDRLRSSLGAGTAHHYARAQSEAIAWVARTADELGIACDFERRPAYTYTTNDEDVAAIKAETEAARDAGLDASFVTQTGLPFEVAGAIRVADQAQFHPRRFLLGLAEHVTRAGGRIVEQTRVVAVEGDERPVLRTAGGARVTAEHVVVATQYPIVDRLKVFTRMTPRREFVVAAPIAAADDPDGMYITAAGDTRSVRTSPYADGQRLLMVTGEHFRPGAGHESDHLQRLSIWARQHFPVGAPTYRWAAQDNGTTDGLPYIGPLDEHLYVATGFGGWGLTNGVVAGLVIPGQLGGQPPEFAGIFDPGRLHPVAEAGGLLKGALSVAAHAIGDRLRPSGSVKDIAPGAGAVVRISGHQRAVYRDDDGSLHAVSATCTHLGCTVAFNDVERSWDCPCHGSRFGTDGSVLQGPAVEPLKPAPLD